MSIWILIAIIFNLLVIFYLVDKVIGIKNLASNLTKKGISDINSHKVKVISDYTELKKEGADFTYDELNDYVTSVVNRAITCKECWQNGSCTSCGCEIKGLMFTPSSVCDAGKWIEMKNIKLTKKEGDA